MFFYVDPDLSAYQLRFIQ